MKSLFSNIILSLALCFSLSPINSLAGQANLAWDPPEISTDATGYMIHYGTSSGTYSQGVDVGNTTSFPVGNLIDGQTYFFAVTAYNAAGYQSDYSNEVSFMTAPPQYLLLTLKSGTGQGTVSGPGISCGDTCLAVYNPGTVVSLSGTADPGSTFAGWSGGGCSGTAQCTATMGANITITASFNPSIVNYSLTASVNGAGGTISPTGTLSVSSGGSQAFSITPASGYSVAGVMVDGKSIGAVNSYTFNNVAANHTIVATFSTSKYFITASAGTGGRISPTGTLSVSSGGSQTFSITPASGYSVAGVMVDGKSIGAVNNYTFRNVAANHTIAATFNKKRR